MPARVLIDGVSCPDGRVLLDADDPGLCQGQSVFETLRTYGRRPFRTGEHLERLRQSAAALAVPFHDPRLLEREMAMAIEGVGGGECIVRVQLTAGGHRIVRASPLQAVEGSARVALLPGGPPAWLPGTVKHTSRAASAMALRATGATEVLWVDPAGNLLEGTRSNVLAVVGGEVRTPPLDGRILAGVTRGVLLGCAAELGIAVREAPLPAALPVDELYLCSTLRELQPVLWLDDRPAPGAGPVGARLLAAFRAKTASAAAEGGRRLNASGGPSRAS